MMNAKQEIITFITNTFNTWNVNIKCAKVGINGGRYTLDYKILKVGFSETDYTNWLIALDIDYDCTQGEQVIGTIWFEDGSWADRYSECGSENQPEWWGLIKMPEINSELL
jgi:hypothetical protein